MNAGFAGHLLRGERAQLLVNQCEKPVRRASVAMLDALQDLGHVAHAAQGGTFRGGKEAGR